MGQVLNKIAYLFISLGALGWIITLLFYGGDVRYQIISIIVVGLGVFVAHFWEELYYNK
jgi:fatty acid desaturase